MHVLALRPEEAQREHMHPYRCLVPLPEVLAEIRGVGPQSRTVEQAVSDLVARLGPEIDILERLPMEDVAREADPLLVEALSRLRAGKVHRDAGYDGEYGVIRLFEPDEIRGRAVVASLFAPSASEGRASGMPFETSPPGPLSSGAGEGEPTPNRVSLYASASLFAGLPPLHFVERGQGGEVLKGMPSGPSPALLDALDPEQRAAAESLDGPLLIVAGPGTGKTRVLTHRLAHLVAERGVSPSHCLAVTFSRRAASEMEERLAALIPGAADRPLVTTFHGLGLTLLREQAGAAGLARGFRVATPEERTEIARELFDLSPAKADRLLEEIERARRLPASDAILAERIGLYEEAMERRNLLDFDDLLSKPLRLLQERPDLAAFYRERFRWISIDEYQDIDALQYSLIRLLAPPESNLCAIGDPDQSIYGFRGADVGFFLRFREDYPGVRVVHLTRNYRSTSTLVEAACQAIRRGSLVPDRRLVAVRGGAAERVVIQGAASERAEAELVVNTLEQLLGGTAYFSFDSGRVESGDTPELSFDDVAILYRTDAQAAPLIEALGRAGIPFQKRSHRPLAEQPGVRALMTAMQKRADDSESSVEVLLEKTVLALAEGSAGRTALLAGAELLRPLALRSRGDLDAFLAEAAHGAEVEAWDPRAERVSLLTLHAAKGLEFPVVFLVGCEDGLLPLTWPGAEDSLDEERRLFFVGITRARSRLFLFYSRKRTLRGESREIKPSPFLADLEEALLDRRQGPVIGPRRPEQLRLL